MIKKLFKENWVYMLIIVMLVIVFTIMMNTNISDKILLFDKKVISFVVSKHNNYFTYFFKILTNFGDIYIPCLILVCILLFNNNRWVFLLQSSGYLLAGIITYFSKLIIARPRPIEALINIPKSFSFPSGHTLTSIVFYVLLIYLLTYHRKIGVRRILLLFAFIFSLLIALSRIYLGVHYFSDVIGGIILSIPCLLLFFNIIDLHFKKRL